MIFYIGILIAVLFLVLVIMFYRNLDKKTVYKNLKGKHVVVTGGASGIGEAVAVQAAQLGANVTIIFRDEDEHRLQKSVYEVQKHCRLFSGQTVQYIVLDVTSEYELIESKLSHLEAGVGPIFMLINCAGKCICEQFEKMNTSDIKQMIDLNYFGTAYPTRYVLPGMKQRNEGSIIFVSSEASLIGIYGYSAYSAAKWAVRGLAESVFMELVGTNVNLTLAFPPDTDTPGFKAEQLTKPKETKFISSTRSLLTPEEVGSKIIRDAMKGKRYSTFGFSGHLLSLLYCRKIDSVTQVLIQILSLSLLCTILVWIQLSFHKIVRYCLKERQPAAQENENNQ